MKSVNVASMLQLYPLSDWPRTIRYCRCVNNIALCLQGKKNSERLLICSQEKEKEEGHGAWMDGSYNFADITAY